MSETPQEDDANRELRERHERWRQLAKQLSVDAIRQCAAAGSGHPTSSMSAAELVAVLWENHLRYDFAHPDEIDNDRFILSKGHASTVLYAALRACGAISDAEMLTYRKRGSRLGGHPTPALPFVDVATGSLGQGLPVGVGMALAAKLLDTPARIWVLCGDSEMAEGSIDEALEHAGHYHLDNLTVIVDVNRLGQSGPTMHEWDLDAYAARAAAFGCHPLVIDGHDVAAIDRAYAEARALLDAPTVIVARTEKGHGVAAVADKEGFHGKPIPNPDEAIAELGGRRDLSVAVARPQRRRSAAHVRGERVELPEYRVGDEVATRNAYGEALAALGHARDDVVVLDGEVGNSTMSEKFKAAFPERTFEMFIAEQQMVAAAQGFAALGLRPFASTFAAFFTRAHDFIRMAAVTGSPLVLCGSHAGVSIGEDGPSQMGLEDLAMMRGTFGATVLYPCDANQCAALTAALVDVDGIAYLRTTRGKTPVIYEHHERFPIGGSKALRTSDRDDVTIVAAGVTVHEALAAADDLAHHGISARVIDAYSVKPIDDEALARAALETEHIVTVEDHFAEGGLGEAVLASLARASVRARVTLLAVQRMSGSATPVEQRADAGIDARAIVAAVHAFFPPPRADVEVT